MCHKKIICNSKEIYYRLDAEVVTPWSWGSEETMRGTQTPKVILLPHLVTLPGRGDESMM